MRPQIALLLTLITPWSVSSQTYTISTFAGCTVQVNIPGTSASLSAPQAVAVDSTGNVFFVEQNAVVRLDATTGILTLVAGNGTAGFSGDNGPATSACLSDPSGVVLDAAGDIFIADTANNRIREVINGVITTVAGSGYPGSAGGFSGDGGPATSAQLNNPYGAAVDSTGNIYIADTNNNRVRKVSNGVITTVAGNGTAGFSGDGGPTTSAQLNYPLDVAVDFAGNVYIADSDNYRVREVTNGVITTVAGNGTAGFSGDNGPAISAELGLPEGISVDSAGRIYIADELNNRIRKVSNGAITTVAGGGTTLGDNGLATAAQLNAPAGVAVDSLGNLYIADESNNRIRKVTNGVITTVAGGGSSLGDNGPAISAHLNGPAGVAVDSAGNVYIADTNNSRIRQVTTGVITTVAGNGTAGFSGDNGPATSAELSYPSGVAVDLIGNIYVADTDNGRVRKVADGVITSASIAYLAGSSGIAVDSAGNVYVADKIGSSILKVTNGMITTVAGNGTLGFSGDNGPAIDAELSLPSGVAVDSAGDIFIADSENNRIRKVTNGVITTVAGDGANSNGSIGDNGPAINAELAYPTGVAVDSAGDIFIADDENNRIRKVTNGVITTVAGGGLSFGDGGPATSAQLSYPFGVAVDSAGNVYIADSENNRIRLLQPVRTSFLVVSKTHTGNFAQGQQGATYTLTVSNGTSGGATSGLVTVTDTIPGGLTLASMSGTGWSCSSNTCSRSDVLNPGSSFPIITVTVNVASNAVSQVTNQVTVWGGGSGSASASDVTTITGTGQAPGAVTIFSPGQGATGVALNTPLTWSTVSEATSYNVYFGASTPLPLATTTTATSYSPAMTPGTTYYWSVTAVNAFGSTPSMVWSFTTAPTSGFRFVPVTPCRVMDTRDPAGNFGAPSLAASATRNVPIPQSACNIPSTAQAYSLNITAVPAGPLTYLSVWPAGQSQPVVSTLNSFDGRVVANAAIVPAGTNGAISLYASNATDAIIDINGYFAPASTSGSMSFYSVTPCRVVDTRGANGLFGGPFLAGDYIRSFAIPSSSCGVPAAAQAYSLNITVVPHTPLGYLSVWPAGQNQPLVSTLNSLDGTIVANAAIVPAGTGGAINVYTTNDTDLIIDINGYFAAPGSAGALSLYTLTPCRVVDTRNTAGPLGGPTLAANGTRSFAIPSSACSVPSTAQSYSLNVTVVPPGPLTYLTAWPTGQSQPVVSTLNSPEGTVAANAAIVPAGTAGAVSIFVSNPTDVILDINAYFAQ